MLPPLHSHSDSVCVEVECVKEEKNILFFKKALPETEIQLLLDQRFEWWRWRTEHARIIDL